MKPDRTTKLLLLTIALGLFMNAIAPWLRPSQASAQTVPTADAYLLLIQGSVDKIANSVEKIERNTRKP